MILIATYTTPGLNSISAAVDNAAAAVDQIVVSLAVIRTDHAAGEPVALRPTAEPEAVASHTAPETSAQGPHMGCCFGEPIPRCKAALHLIKAPPPVQATPLRSASAASSQANASLNNEQPLTGYRAVAKPRVSRTGRLGLHSSPAQLAGSVLWSMDGRSRTRSASEGKPRVAVAFKRPVHRPACAPICTRSQCLTLGVTAVSLAAIPN